MRVKELKIEAVERVQLFLGFAGESEHTQIRFDATSVYEENPHAYASLLVKNAAGLMYPVILSAEGNTVIWDVAASDLTAVGTGSYQLTFTDEGETIKTFIGSTNVRRSLSVDGDIPTPIETWVEHANEKLAAVQAATEAIDNMDASADRLEPGTPPTVEVTDVDGHKHIAFGIPQGEKGEKGDKGDTYVVTPENIEEISSRVVQSATIAQYTEGMADQVEAAQQHARDAGESATSADTAKKDAAQSAQAASQSATAADTSARNAAQSATDAGNSASAASRSAQAASQSATNAANSERNAADSAQDAHDVLDSIPADYSALSSDVTSLKSALTQSENILIGSELLSFTKGYYNTVTVGNTFTPAIKPSNDYYCTHKECSAGDVFSVSIKGGGNSSGGARAIMFVDSNNVCLLVAATSGEYNREIIAPENTAHVYINNHVTVKPSYYAVYGHITKDQISELQTAISALNTKVDDVAEEVDFNLLEGATWEQGAWSGYSTYPPTPTASSSTRVRTHITIDKPLYMIDIALNDQNYNYEYSAFTEAGANISYKSSWQSNKIVITSNVPIKHIYIDMRKSNNANVTPAIVQYLDLYPHEIKDVKDIVSYCQDISNQIGTASAGIYKIRVMSHNVGKFNYGNSGGYSGDDVAQKLLDWKSMYARLEPDILCGQENVLYFDANQTISPANDLFAPLFPEYFSNGNYATFIRSKPVLNSKTDISLSVTVGGTTYTRNASTAIIVVNGINILVVSTHFSPGYTADAETARGLQADELITALSGYDHVIICGDFNSSEEVFFQKFKTAGYTCVNHGYWGVVDTLPNESVDNIICKGFVPYNIICNSEDKCTSDHYPVISDLYLNAD